MVVDKLRARWNRSNKKSSFQSEVYYQKFDEFVIRSQVQEMKERLRGIDEYLNSITPQLVDIFHTE